ncbi:hypothetical protein [Bartonella australis]|uniref:hypothetical protein n=1 Tax=Bartonella australis TaxID=388640 RepID=UPI00034A5CC1|nr:hypothetical protein [Bartonella australis]
MIDFVGILKKTINAQDNVTPQLRERIYERATETLERKFGEVKISKAAANAQRKALQSAIATVEKEYLAIEEELLSSIIGWKPIDEIGAGEGKQDSALSESNGVSVSTTKKIQKSSVAGLIGDKVFDEPSVISGVPGVEPANIEDLWVSYAHEIDRSAKKRTRAVSTSTPQEDNSHIVSHIFSQALRRTNRSSVRRRILVGIIAFVGLVILFISIFIIFGRIFISENHPLKAADAQVVEGLPKVVQGKRKLTQRLLDNGREIDVGPAEQAESLNDIGADNSCCR